jgi:hypothetical protein
VSSLRRSAAAESGVTLGGTASYASLDTGQSSSA